MSHNDTINDRYQVLLVEDNMINRRLISKLLSSLQLDVTEATSGEQAIALCSEHSFDLILMDVMMPGKNGYETTEHIRTLDKTGASVPIIALTADHTPTAIEKAKQHGMDDCLSKPLNQLELKRILKEYVYDNDPEYQEILFDQAAFETFYPNPSLRIEIIDLLLDDEQSSIVSIKTAFASTDCSTIYQKIHYLKGSFNYFKATRLVTLSLAILTQCKQKDLQGVLSLQESFIANYQVFRDTLRSYKATLSV